MTEAKFTTGFRLQSCNVQYKLITYNFKYIKQRNWFRQIYVRKKNKDVVYVVLRVFVYLLCAMC